MTASTVWPSCTSTTGTPSTIRPMCRYRHVTHDSTVIQNPNVLTARIAPVSDMSSWVIPC
jgi:hypothetical protein